MENIFEHRYNTADELLNWVASEKKVKTSVPVDVNQIAEFLNLKINYEMNFDDTVGSISFCDEGAVININQFENTFEPRRRFTLAHEIGHYCLHRSSERTKFVDDRKTMSRSGSYWDVYESEANNFAAELLMPKKLVVEKGREVINSYLTTNNVKIMPARQFIENMSSLFQASNPAMEYRLRNLGFIK